MFSKIKIALAAIALFGSASAVLAQSSGEVGTGSSVRNPNARVLTFQNRTRGAYGYQWSAPRAYQPSGRLIEGRNLGVRIAPNPSAGTGTYETIPSFGGY